MAEFDDKLNSLLSNPEAMSQIMQLAQSFSAGEMQPQTSPPPEPKADPSDSRNPKSEDLLSSLTGGIDPGLMLKLLPLIQELGGQRDSHARQLLYALRPYLRNERQEKVERALQLARLFCVGKKFLADWGDR